MEQGILYTAHLLRHNTPDSLDGWSTPWPP